MTSKWNPRSDFILGLYLLWHLWWLKPLCNQKVGPKRRIRAEGSLVGFLVRLGVRVWRRLRFVGVWWRRNTWFRVGSGALRCGCACGCVAEKYLVALWVRCGFVVVTLWCLCVSVALRRYARLRREAAPPLRLCRREASPPSSEEE